MANQVRSGRKLRSFSEVSNAFRNDLKTDICYDVIEGVKTSTYCPFHPERRNSKQAVLLSALGEGVVQPGAQCTGFTQNKTGVCAYFAGGKEVWGDVLIGADGIHSLIRSQLFGQAKPRYAGYTAGSPSI